MSGGYTHITLAQLAIEEATYRRTGLIHMEASNALRKWKKFCIVGAVSPDYPYLKLNDRNAAAWADAMHQGGALDLLRIGVATISQVSDLNVRQKCTAWLFGFAAHVATDGTIHPVVNLKVGAYEENKTAHRECEMSQDVYVHRRLNMGALEFNRQISTNIHGTADSSDENLMDRDIAWIWELMLKNVYPAQLSDGGNPQVHDWHRAMRKMIKIGESGNKLFPFARHVAAGMGLMYPAAPSNEFIENLLTPNSSRMHFEEVFQMALSNVLNLWGWLSLSLQGQSSPLDSLANWSLDTGIDENGQMVYWG